ncbi:MAG: SDR family NAD(P)-dependent oxidoreductase [Saprospirales bacterium]|nr:SDR family NAD(P)-dependent oxidoreductase [Saprospirales bacterium]
MEKKYTLITGGSSGIGRSLAFECARRGMHVALVALPGPELAQTAQEISSLANMDVPHFAIDLTELDAPGRVFQWCVDQRIQVDFLINNAGIAGSSAFEQSDPGYSDERILLNVRALVLLTRYFIPMLKESPGSKILNIGSLSGFFPVPYKSVYAASKAFVISFSKSLAKELEKANIRVTVVCPNGVVSNELSRKRIMTHKFWGKLTTLTSDRLAVLTLDRVEKGNRVYVPLFINRLLLFVEKFIPEKWISHFLEKEFRGELKY